MNMSYFLHKLMPYRPAGFALFVVIMLGIGYFRHDIRLAIEVMIGIWAFAVVFFWRTPRDEHGRIKRAQRYDSGNANTNSQHSPK